MTYPAPMLQRRLHRNTINKWVGGVFQGIADTYGWDVTLLRILFVGSSFLLPDRSGCYTCWPGSLCLRTRVRINIRIGC